MKTGTLAVTLAGIISMLLAGHYGGHSAAASPTFAGASGSRIYDEITVPEPEQASRPKARSASELVVIPRPHRAANGTANTTLADAHPRFNATAADDDDDDEVLIIAKRSYWCQSPDGINDELYGRSTSTPLTDEVAALVARDDTPELIRRFAKVTLCACSSPGVAGYDPYRTRNCYADGTGNSD